MAGHGEKFGRKKEDAIAALLSQPSVEQAARVAGVGTRTLVRWLQVPEFKAAYHKARRDAFRPGYCPFTASIWRGSLDDSKNHAGPKCSSREPLARFGIGGG